MSGKNLSFHGITITIGGRVYSSSDLSDYRTKGISPPHKTVASAVKDSIHTTLNKEDDSGTATITTGISAAETAVKTFRTAQQVSPYAVKASIGIYHVGEKTVKVVKTVDSTIAKIKCGVIPLNRNTMIQFRDYAAHQVINTHPMKRLIHTVNSVNNGVKTAAITARKYSIIIGNGTKKAVTVASGVLNGTIVIKVTKEDLIKFRNAAWRGTRVTGKYVGKVAGRGIKTGVVKGGIAGKHTVKGLSHGVAHVGNILSDTDDMGAQTIGVGIKTAEYSVRFVKYSPTLIKNTYHGLKTAVAVPIKTGRAILSVGKGIKGAAELVKSIGIKDTIRHFRNKAIMQIAKAGGSAVTAVLGGLKTFGLKVVLPLALIAACVFMISSAFSAPIATIASLFGGEFTNKTTGEDVDAHSYLTEAVTNKRPSLVKTITKIRDTNASTYSFIDLYINDDMIDISENSINAKIYSVNEIVSLIEPIYKTVILSKYDDSPTQAEMDNTLDDIWNTLFTYTTKVMPSRYETVIDSVDKNGKVKSHVVELKVLAIIVKKGGYDELLAKYFTDPIDKLANMKNRTTEQDNELQSLKENYELCLEYIDEVSTENGGTGNSNIGSVNLIDGNRPNIMSMVNTAAAQLGNSGGEKFWNWYGFDSRIAWCACFVSWVADQNGYIAKGIIPKFSLCEDGVDWFKQRNEWVAGGYKPVAGDIIFFDWNGDKHADHVGIVVGNDGNKVYTIEGNNGDECRRSSYAINSTDILGYGLPKY